ncbi:unnamed protein product [Rotaria magnacalcarata]|uniref:Uncharacterized protein n=1 Tax=Rotaria magnacalcarata TaxID=392030 RepID=A0A816KEA8_9BILA|nr:unnamed protein product [Rotaria magnacalcarata]
MTYLSQECCEPEIIELRTRYEHTHHDLSKETKDAVLKRLRDYGGTKQRLSQLLDEEQKRELEQELEEERQLERPPSVEPCKPIMHKEIERLCDMHRRRSH